VHYIKDGRQRELVKGLMEEDPERRMSVEKAMVLPYFTKTRLR
jgi:hypothetical protein